MSLGRRTFGLMLLGTALATSSVVLDSVPANAVEVGQPAPDFKVPSTQGAEIALSDFKGKKWVFLEFYGLDFQPT